MEQLLAGLCRYGICSARQVVKAGSEAGNRACLVEGCKTVPHIVIVRGWGVPSGESRENAAQSGHMRKPVRSLIDGARGAQPLGVRVGQVRACHHNVLVGSGVAGCVEDASGLEKLLDVR